MPQIGHFMSTVTTSTISSAPLISKRAVIDWLGIAPFMIFALLFLILPTIYLVAGAFLTPDGSFTLKNIGSAGNLNRADRLF